MLVVLSEFLEELTLTLVIGVICAFLFDFSEQVILKIKLKYKYFLIAVRDFIFVVLYCILLILMIYYFNKGAFRGIYILVSLLGAFIYFFLLYKLFRSVISVVLIPLSFVTNTIIKIIRKILTFFLYAIEKIYFRLYNMFKNYRYWLQPSMEGIIRCLKSHLKIK